jgi:hypothetical protein
VFNGHTWKVIKTHVAGDNDPSKVSLFQSISCPTTTFCLALDDAGNADAYNGSNCSGAVPFGLASDATAEQVSCPSPALCVVIDDADNAYLRAG